MTPARNRNFLKRYSELRMCMAFVIVAIFGSSSAVGADPASPTTTQLNPPQGRSGSRPSNGAYKLRISPHWNEAGTHFWYRNDLPGGTHKFILVDAEAGDRRQAFDHAKLAKSLNAAGVSEASAERLPIRELQFDVAQQQVNFITGDERWDCDLKTYELTKREEASQDDDDKGTAKVIDRGPFRSATTGPETNLTFVNKTNVIVELFWIDPEGRPRSYGTLPAGEQREQHTYAGHVWSIMDEQRNFYGAFRADENALTAVISEKQRRPSFRGRGGRGRNGDARSPNGQWRAFIRQGNIYLQLEDGESDEIPLSSDGTEEIGYDQLSWSPDSKKLAAFRVTRGDQKEVYTVESSPTDGGRAKLHTRAYALPGDAMTKYELYLIDVEQRELVKADVDPIDFGRPRVRWHDANTLTYEKTDRGHQRFRLIHLNVETGESRDIIDEKSETFVWSYHGPDVPRLSYLSETDELIYSSERDGWRHLYLVNRNADVPMQQITRGKWIVRDIEFIDEQNRQICFAASGMNANQDPYFQHYYRINFDGTGLVTLTKGNGDHSVEFSPDRRFLVDTRSRIDAAPVHTLRRADDGELVCRLERSDISELIDRGWRAPEVFSAKGRDGETDIWGFICYPTDYDPEKKYPILEHIYAGPHDSHVPKSFRPLDWYQSMTDAGFFVVKIDGMGTANRSKAFHDVCWHNLKDAGLPDRILWVKAAAEMVPAMDTTRVGIYGTSAGGQNAAGAVLFHPEFYKVAVAACGCHDNRMDKASWNEQWMGYPVGPHFAASSNIDNAHRLQGQLLLIVGELDSNVPPESTFRFVDALIKADKDFELLVIPGAGHTSGGTYGARKTREFFMRHLQDNALPNHNAAAGNLSTAAGGR